MKGTYILIIRLEKDQSIKIGSLGSISFSKGYYFYVGSAFGKSVSIESRVSRHLSKNKKLRWHIDYFLMNENAQVIDALVFEGKKIECKLAKKLSKNFVSIKKFGCSDCSCKSHFFYSREGKIPILGKSNFVSFHKQRVGDNRDRA